MIRAWIHGTGLSFAGAGALVFVFLAIFRQPKTRIRCPGERWTRRDLIFPWRWLRTHSCGYDLTGVPRNIEDLVICPECGRSVRSVGELVSSAWRGRLKQSAALLLIASMVFYSAPWLRSGRWAKRLPTNVLILAEHIPCPIRPRAFRRELDRRANQSMLTREHKHSLIPILIADLRDDDEAWNGMRAMSYLSSWKDLSRSSLEAALRSDDWQQRQLAADLLCDDEAYTPTPDLLRVVVEGLRDDNLPYEKPRRGRKRGAFSYVTNASSGVAYLLKHPGDLVPCLRAGLQSDDRQQRELSAVVAAYAGCTDLIHLAAPILIQGLADNQVGADARHAVAALYSYGALIAPWLLPLQFSTDDQQRALALLVLRELDLVPTGFGPPNPKVLSSVTEIVALNDPCGIGALAHHWANFSIWN